MATAGIPGNPGHFAYGAGTLYGATSPGDGSNTTLNGISQLRLVAHQFAFPFKD